MNVEEILTSIGASSGLFIIYKIAKILYNKYYINSDCHNINDNTTEIQITISTDHHNEHQENHEHHEHHEHHEQKEQKENKKDVE